MYLSRPLALSLSSCSSSSASTSTRHEQRMITSVGTCELLLQFGAPFHTVRVDAQQGYLTHENQPPPP